MELLITYLSVEVEDEPLHFVSELEQLGYVHENNGLLPEELVPRARRLFHGNVGIVVLGDFTRPIRQTLEIHIHVRGAMDLPARLNRYALVINDLDRLI